MESEELLYKIAVSNVKGIGNIGVKKLISFVGDAKAVFFEKRSNLLKIPGINRIQVNNLLQKDVLRFAEEELKFLEKNHVKCFYYLDDSYPKLLKECLDNPVLLYHKGDIDFDNRLFISIVGTRKVTDYGVGKCKEIVKDLTSFNPVIVSGLAYGVDTIAHRAAVDCNISTLAVLGHGLNQIYPAIHRDLAKQMISNGGVLTEFASNTDIHPSNFVQRNRIIAGLSVATIVIESGERGGSLITAEYANNYNRDVFALPGKSSDKRSVGCNRLIKTHKAALLESAKDLIYILGLEKGVNNVPKQLSLFSSFTGSEKIIVDILTGGNVVFDVLAKESKLSIGELSSTLLALEFKGVVICLPGKVYKILNGS